MADFDDMTGWREELQRWQYSKEYRDKEEANNSSQTVVVKLSDLLQYIDLRLKNKDCQEADRGVIEWQAKYGERRTVEGRKHFPGWAVRTFGDFQSWFLFKKQLPGNPLAYVKAEQVIRTIYRGELSSAHSKEAIELLVSDGVDRFIDFEN